MHRFVSVCLMIFVMSAACASAQHLDTRYYYRLHNRFLGNDRSLNPRGGGQPLEMGRSADVTGQMWKFTRLGNGAYRITNHWLGDGYSLDTRGDGNHDPVMNPSGNYSGQVWYLTPLNGGGWRLTNQFLGAGVALDTAGEAPNAPFMTTAPNTTGQCWYLTPVSRISACAPAIAWDKATRAARLRCGTAARAASRSDLRPPSRG